VLSDTLKVRAAFPPRLPCPWLEAVEVLLRLAGDWFALLLLLVSGLLKLAVGPVSGSVSHGKDPSAFIGCK
jgi:hypothetical protein